MGDEDGSRESDPVTMYLQKPFNAVAASDEDVRGSMNTVPQTGMLSKSSASGLKIEPTEDVIYISDSEAAPAAAPKQQKSRPHARQLLDSVVVPIRLTPIKRADPERPSTSSSSLIPAAASNSATSTYSGVSTARPARKAATKKADAPAEVSPSVCRSMIYSDGIISSASGPVAAEYQQHEENVAWNRG